MPFDNIEDAIRDIKKGKFVILVDDEDRENEGDLVIAAEKVTPQAINFMAKHARGLICLALTPERVEELHLPQQAVENTATFGTAFTVSIDARRDITTGISAADRATTIRVAIDPKSAHNGPKPVAWRPSGPLVPEIPQSARGYDARRKSLETESVQRLRREQPTQTTNSRTLTTTKSSTS